MNLLDFISLRKCLLCDRQYSKPEIVSLCSTCFLSLRDSISLNCKEIPLNDSTLKVYYPLEYAGLVRFLMRKFKYEDKELHRLWGELGSNFLTRFLLPSLFDSSQKLNLYFSEVPISKEKLSKRGYNQSELISKYISSNMAGSDYVQKLFFRILDTPSMYKLNFKKRFQHMNSVFGINSSALFKLKKQISRDQFENFAGKTKSQKHILVIVDDIVTTGASFASVITSLQESSKKKESFFDEIILLACSGREL